MHIKSYRFKGGMGIGLMELQKVGVEFGRSLTKAGAQQRIEELQQKTVCGADQSQ